MSVQTEVLTIEVAIERTWQHERRRNFQASLVEDVMEAAVNQAREKGVVLVRVGRVPNRKHAKASS